MRNYFDTNKDNVIDHERRIFPLLKDNFIIPANLMIKLVPDIVNQIKLIGTISRRLFDDSESGIILVGKNSDRLLGISENCYRKFGINPALTFNSSIDYEVLTFHQLFPDIPSIKDFIVEPRKSIEQVLDSEILEGKVYQDKDIEGLLEPLSNEEDVFIKHEVQLDVKEIYSFRYMDEEIVEVHVKTKDFSFDSSPHFKNLLDQTGQIIENPSETRVFKETSNPLQKKQIFEGNEEETLDPEILKARAIEQERERRIREKRSNYLRKPRTGPLQLFKYLNFFSFISVLISSQIYLFFQLQAVIIFPKVIRSSFIDGMKNKMVINLASESYRLELLLK